MKTILVLSAILIALGAATASAARLSVNSPKPGMRFTAGLPLRVWGNLRPRDDVQGWPQVECYWDDQMVEKRVLGNLKGFDYFPFLVPAEKVTPGIHQLRLKGFVRDRSGPRGPRTASAPAATTAPGPEGTLETTVSIQIDPWPADKKVIELTEDLTATDLDWTNVAVRGNGHVVKVSGKLTIKNCLITGLGSMKIEDPSNADPKDVAMVPGITGTLTGPVDIEDSIFEATGALNLTINGSDQVAIKNNEFRATNFIKFVPYLPDASPVIEISGSNATHKLFQGNRIAAGRVIFSGMKDWLIGAGEDQNEADGNILIGQRCTINVLGCSNVTVRGNYSHHTYIGEWSQGFNFVFSKSTVEILVEHNLIEGSSWPVQDLGGEFRYNVVVGYGHEWVRTVLEGTSIHHNVFAPTGGGGLGFGIWCYINQQYSQAKGIKIYNNTFDGGAPIGDFAGPFVGISTASVEVVSLRNNLFTYARDTQNGSAGLPLVRVEAGSILYADYNAFYSPHSKQTKNYSLTIPDKKQGDAGFAGHDVSATGAIGVVDGRLAAHPFAGQRFYPYTVDEGAVWNRQIKLSQVLADFRARYTPAPGSPLIDKGDPADGPGVDIGAIEAPGGAPRPEDLLGKYGKPTASPVPTPARAATMPARVP